MYTRVIEYGLLGLQWPSFVAYHMEKYKRTHIIKKNSTDTYDKSLHFDMPVLMHCCMLHTFIVETMLAKHSSNDTFHWLNTSVIVCWLDPEISYNTELLQVWLI